MWFKQAICYHISDYPKSAETFASKLESLAFQPCLPTFPMTQGWITPLQQADAPLVYALPGYFIFCLQFEEKLLPATVIKQALDEKIQAIETEQQRRMKQKEKQSLKDEVTHTLLPRAFSKLSRVYAYIDLQHNYLVIDTTQEKKLDTFLSWLKRAISNISIKRPEIHSPTAMLTAWLGQKQLPRSLDIEKHCVLQDPSQTRRTIRCDHQDLFSISIQSLLKEEFAVKQLALDWQEQIQFRLYDDFSLRQLRFQDTLIQAAKEYEAETADQQFAADALILTKSLSTLLHELLDIFAVKNDTPTA